MIPEKTKEYQIKVSTFAFSPSQEGVLTITDNSHLQNTLDKTSIFEIHHAGNLKGKIRYDWSHNTFEEVEYLYVPETARLFFGGGGSWGVINLDKFELIRLESVMLFWYLARHGNTIVAVEEISAESSDLYGQTISTIPIDPPFETIVFDDRIEFDCIVHGKQILKLI